MKRVLIFCILGTVLVTASVIALYVSPRDQYFSSIAIGLAESFVAPALLVMYLLSVVDKALAHWSWQRVVACAVVGYVGVAIIQIVYDRQPDFFFPLASAIPAAICSWLSGPNKRTKEN